MILLNNVKIPLEADFADLKPYAAAVLKTDLSQIRAASLYKKSVDARKKENVHFCCSLLVDTVLPEGKILKQCKNAAPYLAKPYVWKQATTLPEKRPVVVGFGPAGMFAALTLSRAGLCPLVLERGGSVEERTVTVERFFAGGALDPECNVQFGEGGAGTFSDGKLNSGIKDPRCRAVLKTFYEYGAPERILTDAKPHIGTDILTKVVKNIRLEILRLGGEVRFHAKLEDLRFSGKKLTGITASGEEIPCDTLVLAIGHSARDTFSLLQSRGAAMCRKPFSVGVRIEHLQSDIDRALYGDFADHPALMAADYKLAAHPENGRGVYTFCMCPGGQVVNASSEQGGIAVNGMSMSRRDGANANSAVLVEVLPTDFAGDDPLAGCFFQRNIEQAAFAANGGAVPVTTAGQFLFGKPFSAGKIKPTVKPSYAFTEFSSLFPDFVTNGLKQGILLFDKKIKGFADPDAILTAPETRSSSPVRLLRGEDGQSVSLGGVYPCGEGAGYAGGILSAAVDGIKTAEALMSAYSDSQTEY